MLQCTRESQEVVRCPAGHLRIQRGLSHRVMDLHLREPEAREPPEDHFLRRHLLQIGTSGFLLPVSREDARNPVSEFVFEEPDVIQRIVTARWYRIALEVRSAGCIRDLDERLAL